MRALSVAKGVGLIIAGIVILALEIAEVAYVSGYIYLTTLPIVLLVWGGYEVKKGIERRKPLAVTLQQGIQGAQLAQGVTQGVIYKRSTGLLVAGVLVLLSLGIPFLGMGVTFVIIMMQLGHGLGLGPASYMAYIYLALGAAFTALGGYLTYRGAKRRPVPFSPPLLTSPLATPAAAAVQAQQPALHRYCLACGSLVPPGMSTCPRCGTPVEDVYAVVHSPKMKRGLTRGYAVLVTSKRIVGSKWHKISGDVLFAVYHSYNLDPSVVMRLTANEYEDAYRMAFRILQEPDFVMPVDSIARIEVKPARFLRGGSVSFHYTDGEVVKVSMGLNKKSAALNILDSALRRLAGDKVEVLV